MDPSLPCCIPVFLVVSHGNSCWIALIPTACACDSLSQPVLLRSGRGSGISHCSGRALTQPRGPVCNTLLPEHREPSCVLSARSLGHLCYAQLVPNHRTYNLQIHINSSCRRNGLYIFMQRKNGSLSPKSLLQQDKNTNVKHVQGPKILDKKCLKDSSYTPVISIKHPSFLNLQNSWENAVGRAPAIPPSPPDPCQPPARGC